MSSLRAECPLDRVGDVALVDGRVNLRALAADASQIRVRRVPQNFVDLSVVERRSQTAGKPLGQGAESRPLCAASARSASSSRAAANRVERGNSGFRSRNSVTRSHRTSAV